MSRKSKGHKPSQENGWTSGPEICEKKVIRCPICGISLVKRIDQACDICIDLALEVEDEIDEDRKMQTQQSMDLS